MIQKEPANSTYYAIDLGSANGTFINANRIITPTKLTDGDTISFGKTEFTFQTTHRAPSPSTLAQVTGDKTVACIDKKKATIFVCDIHRYTELSEQIGNEEISNILQTWNRLTSKIILKFKGQIDKFIGDAVLAFWIHEDNEPLIGILPAALLIHQMTTKLGIKHNLPFPLSIGVVINTGEIMLGNIGRSGQRDYTIIGDAVNTTFRLESKTSSTQEVIIGKETYSLIKSPKKEFTLQTFDLKGKKDKIEAYITTFKQLETGLKTSKKN